MTFVLDNSVAIAWCFEEEQTAPIVALFHRVAQSGALAPALWPIEAMNGLLAAERRRRVDAARRMELVTFLHDLPILLDDETMDQVWTETVDWPIASALRSTTPLTSRSPSGAACRRHTGP